MNKSLAMTTMDFGMRWIPSYHRETSTQYCAKKGLAYHGVSYEQVISPENGQHEGAIISSNSHIQVLQGTSLQDSDSVVALIFASLSDYKAVNPRLRVSYLRQIMQVAITVLQP